MKVLRITILLVLSSVLVACSGPDLSDVKIYKGSSTLKALIRTDGPTILEQISCGDLLFDEHIAMQKDDFTKLLDRISDSSKNMSRTEMIHGIEQVQDYVKEHEGEL